MHPYEKRRTFAIISHPDAGKTTLTEKLLLYGGAIHQAGAVKSRKAARAATSDWMEIERKRGISVTSSAMAFEFGGYRYNLLDTPGHQDFSEDTYRTLTAADCAIMLIDAAKGVEAQTRKLFEVCRMRGTPIVTFVNKLDRPARDPMELMTEVEEVLKLRTAPVTWPAGSGEDPLSPAVAHTTSGEIPFSRRPATASCCTCSSDSAPRARVTPACSAGRRANTRCSYCRAWVSSPRTTRYIGASGSARC